MWPEPSHPQSSVADFDTSLKARQNSIRWGVRRREAIFTCKVASAFTCRWEGKRRTRGEKVGSRGIADIEWRHMQTNAWGESGKVDEGKENDAMTRFQVVRSRETWMSWALKNLVSSLFYHRIVDFFVFLIFFFWRSSKIALEKTLHEIHLSCRKKMESNSFWRVAVISANAASALTAILALPNLTKPIT